MRQDVSITHVACGKYHTAAVATDGTVYAWGLESSGQLGLGSYRTKAPTPQAVPALSGAGVTQLACGMYHTVALTSAGEVLTCGFGGSFFNGAGGLGLGDRTQRDAPEMISAFGGGEGGGAAAVSVSAGAYHSVAMDADGVCWSWGRGEWGRLGHNDASDCLEPTRIEGCEVGGKGATFLGAGDSHCASLGADGAAYTWGRNEHWQLGYEVAGLLNAGQSLDAQQEPQRVELPEEHGAVVRVACGELGTAAILSDGAIYVWGMARFFEPTKVLHTSDVDAEIADLSLGAYHLAIRTVSGKLYTFGAGAPLGLPRTQRAQWQLREVNEHSLDGKPVLAVACGPASTAIIC